MPTTTRLRAAPHPTPPHTTPHHTTPHHTLSTPQFLFMRWVPGAKLRTTGPGHCPSGGVLIVSGVRTPQCQTPPPGSPRPPSTASTPSSGRLGFGNGQRPLVRTAGTASPSSPPARPPRTQGPPQSLGTRLPHAECFCPPCRRPPPALVPPSHSHLHPRPHRRSGRRRGGPPTVGLRRQRRGQVCASDRGTRGVAGRRPCGGKRGLKW